MYASFTGLKCLILMLLMNALPTNQPTDQPTDRPTNGQSGLLSRVHATLKNDRGCGIVG